MDSNHPTTGDFSDKLQAPTTVGSGGLLGSTAIWRILSNLIRLCLHLFDVLNKQINVVRMNKNQLLLTAQWFLPNANKTRLCGINLNSIS